MDWTEVKINVDVKDVDKADQIAFHIGERVLDGVAHSGLGCKVDDPVEAFRLEKGGECLPVCDVAKPEIEIRAEFGQPRAFQRNGVVVVEVVDTDNRVASFEQPPAQVEAYESGCAGDKNLHFVMPLYVSQTLR